MMFERLKQRIPSLKPYAMGVDEVEAFKESGLHREEAYLNKVKLALDQETFPLFSEVLEKILAYQVTIEQEVLLHQE